MVAFIRSEGHVIEYKNIASDMFEEMVESIKIDTATYVLKAKLQQEPPKPRRAVQMTEGRGGDNSEPKKKAPVTVNKVGRNDPCPCGSGLKYKKCCGK